MILAGDIGGTNTRLAFFKEEAGRLQLAAEKVYPSREHKGLDEIVIMFLREQGVSIRLACFGIAGPVLHGRVSASNLPWIIDAAELSRHLGTETVWLINDLEAHASGIDDLEPADFINLNSVEPSAGNAALIAAGTGLGEAGLYWDGARRHAFPCEGGHCDFAPRNDLEIALLQYLLKRFGRVSYERVLSGPGLKIIYEFLRDSGTEQEPDWLRQELSQLADPVAAISKNGLEEKAAICQRALEMFVSIYGAEAGNLALKLMATGGLFMSGGIAHKILPKLREPAFLEAFVSKGRLQPVLETIPVRIIVNDKVGLIGAARYAVNQRGPR
ncbi:MAG TPA: glucokinase [Candidatus Solibacter sp.]|nr:glucokinase [Candidatus Solibacter sp.]